MQRDQAEGSCTRDGLFARFVDWVFGYDFFVSYSHADGLGYPRRLRERLEQASFRVFLDQTDYVAGLDLRRETRRQVEKSRKIIVVGRPRALVSEWVRREVDVALLANKIPIIINVNDAVASAANTVGVAALACEHDWLRLNEKVDDPDGEPSAHAISELVRGFAHTRQQTKRQRVLLTAATALAISTGFATWQAIEARRQQAYAERNFGTAREAAEALVVDIARGLRDVEGMTTQSLRKILTRAETAFNALAATAPEDPRLLHDRAAMYNEFVETYLASGDTEAAGKAAEQSVAFAERAAEVAGNDRASRRQLALGFVKLGDALNEIGERAQAQSSHGRALEIRRELAKTGADEVAEREVAISLVRLGGIAENTGELARARDLYIESLDIRKALARRRPDWRRDVIVNSILLGDVLLALGESARAGEVFGETVSLARELCDEDGSSTRALRDLAVASQRMGNYLLSVSDLAGASTNYEESRKLFGELSVLDPSNVEWRRDVAVAVGKMADVARSSGDNAAAAVLLAEAVGLRRSLLAVSPTNAQFAIDLAEALKDLATVSAPHDAHRLWREVRKHLLPLAHKGALTPEQQSWLDRAQRRGA